MGCGDGTFSSPDDSQSVSIGIIIDKYLCGLKLRA